MVFSLLSSCWHYFHQEEYAHEEELPCEEEEEDPTCSVLGEILLFYCLAVAFLKMLHHCLEWMHENQQGGVLISHCWIKGPKGKKDGSRKGSRSKDKGIGCAFCCRIGVCGILRKLFAEPETKALPDSANSSVTLERRLSQRLSRLSQKTFCDNDSCETVSVGSWPASGRASKTEEDSFSVPSLKRQKRSQVAEVPGGSRRLRETPCRRCKAKRTNEWLVQHFFEEDLPSLEG